MTISSPNTWTAVNCYSPIRTPSAVIFRQKTCTKTWLKISSYLTLVILSRPIRCTRRPIIELWGNSKAKPGRLCPLNLLGTGQKCIPYSFLTNSKNQKSEQGDKKIMCKKEGASWTISYCPENSETHSEHLLFLPVCESRPADCRNQ